MISKKMISDTKKRAEAVRRMRAMRLYGPTIRQFQGKEHLVSQSEPPFGACYWLNDEMKAKVKAFEEKYNAIVYHVIRSHLILGGTDRMTMNAFLFVGDSKEEWEQDMQDIKEGYTFAWVDNETAPDLSEFGTIGFALTIAGGLKRTA